jgi:RNA polymerase sigma factor (sigma-70 family)
MVYSVCMKVTGNLIAAEDLAQEVFIKAFRVLSSFRGDARFSTWLYQIAMRKCLDWKRTNERTRKIQMDSPIDDYEVVGITTPEDTVVAQEESEMLVRLVDELHEPYRSITQWYYFDELSYQDISNQTGLPLKTIESRLYRARRMLREKGEALRWYATTYKT